MLFKCTTQVKIGLYCSLFTILTLLMLTSALSNPGGFTTQTATPGNNNNNTEGDGCENDNTSQNPNIPCETTICTEGPCPDSEKAVGRAESIQVISVTHDKGDIVWVGTEVTFTVKYKDVDDWGTFESQRSPAPICECEPTETMTSQYQQNGEVLVEVEFVNIEQ